MAHVWRAEPHEAEVVGQLLVDFRNHLGVDWPSDNAFLAGVDRLIEDPNTVYLLGAPDADTPPAGVAQVRFRYGIWWAAEDCLLEDLFVREEARGTGLGRALRRGASIELARDARLPARRARRQRGQRGRAGALPLVRLRRAGRPLRRAQPLHAPAPRRRRMTAAELLQRLIRFDTTNPPGAERACVALVDELLREAGPRDDDRRRRPRAAEPRRAPARRRRPRRRCCSRATSTSSRPTGQEWTRDPFGGELVDGWIWGRGALDMKGGVAMMLHARPARAARGPRAGGDVVLARARRRGGRRRPAVRSTSSRERPGPARGRHATRSASSAASRCDVARPALLSDPGRREAGLRRARDVPRPGGPRVDADARRRDGASWRRFLRALDRKRLPVHVTPVVRRMVEGIADELPRAGRRACCAACSTRGRPTACCACSATAARCSTRCCTTRSARRCVQRRRQPQRHPGRGRVELDGRILPGQPPDDLLRELRALAGDDARARGRRATSPARPSPTSASSTCSRGVLREADPTARRSRCSCPRSPTRATSAALGIQGYGFTPLQLPARLPLHRDHPRRRRARPRRGGRLRRRPDARRAAPLRPLTDLGAAGAAITSTRCPAGQRDERARGAPQCSSRGSGSKPASRRRASAASWSVGDDRDVALRRHHRLVGEQEVDLRAAPLHPARPLAQRPGGVDLLEAEQRPERRRTRRRPPAGPRARRAGSRRALHVARRGSCAAPSSRRASGSGAVGQRLEVRDVLAQDRQRPRGRRAASPWPGTTTPACSTSGSSRAQRREVRVARAALGAASGSRPARGSRRRRARAPTAPRSPCRPRVWPSAGCSSSSCSPTSSVPGHRQRLDLAERQRPLALDVVLGVERAQLARRVAGLAGQPRRGRLRAAERRVRERQAAEQVVPVAVRGEQAAERGSPPARARAGSTSSSSGQHRRVDDERLVAASGRSCTSSARRGSSRRGRPRGPRRPAWRPRAGYAAPSSLAASASVVTSASGFLRPAELLAGAVDPDDGDLLLQRTARRRGSTSSRRGPSPSCRRCGARTP